MQYLREDIAALRAENKRLRADQELTAQQAVNIFTAHEVRVKEAHELRAALDEAKDERDKFAELLQSAPYSQRLLLDDRARMLADVAREKERSARWKACAKRWRKRASETLALLGRGIEIFDGDDKRAAAAESELTALRVAHEVACCERDAARIERDLAGAERDEQIRAAAAAAIIESMRRARGLMAEEITAGALVWSGGDWRKP